jgi:ubiquinone/menaquinone biosynthesis C-methylase UbiE
MYDSAYVERYFDAFGFKEFERHDGSAEQRIKLELHIRCLRSFIEPGSRVLEIGAGPGRFTEVLASLSCATTVVDLSGEQLRLNKRRAEDLGYAHLIESWLKADICDLRSLGDSAEFDAVVAFGGPLSYVLDRRDQAMAECLRVLAPSGRLLLSVMSKWGTIHAFLHGVSRLSEEEIQAVLRTGDVTPRTSRSSVEGGHFFHMFTASELQEFLAAHGLATEYVASSNAVSTKWAELLEDEGHYATVLRLEEQATEVPGARDMGTHIIAVAGRRG